MEDKNDFFSNIIAQERFLRFKEMLEKEQFDFSLKNNLILKFLLEAKKTMREIFFFFIIIILMLWYHITELLKIFQH